MKSKSITQVYCKTCGKRLQGNHSGPCPKCGGENKDIRTVATAVISVTGSSSWERRREFKKKNPKIYALIIILSIVFLIIGMLFGVIGGLIGFIGSILVLFLGPQAYEKIIKIERGGT